MSEAVPLLRVDHVSKRFRLGPLGRKEMTAVRDVTFEVAAGEAVSLIGESGSGKSTIGRMILRMTGVTSGVITVDGTDIAAHDGRDLREYYRSVQGVFQDPFSSYNPIFKADRVLSMVKDQFFGNIGRAEWQARAEGALTAVRLDPGQVMGKYPHQLSGGQLQRMLIARALLLDTKLLVADEIISMLDASTRIDVLNLLAELTERGLGVLFITHDLSLGNYISERTMIMRRGAIVEMGDTDKVLRNPQHPYSRTLVGAVPRLDRRWVDADAVAPDADAGPCPVHAGDVRTDDRHTNDPHTGDPHTGDTAMVEVESNHYVACFGCA